MYISLFERQSNKDKDIFHITNSLPKCLQQPGLGKLKPGARNSIRFPILVARAQVLRSFSAFSQTH